MKTVEIEKLDQHLKPLQVDGVSTGLELSTESLRISSGELEIKNLTSETAKVNGNLTIDGDIEMSGSSGTKINMYNDVYLEATSNNDYLNISAKNIFLDGSSNYVNSDAGIFITADSGYDTKIVFMEGASTNWSIGNDGGEATSTLSFSSGPTLGTNEEMSINSNGALQVAGDIIAGDDVSMDATGKLRFDGLLGHTYIHEASADDLEIIVGGDTMATFDEANDRITMAATKHTSALADGTEFSATDSAYAGMILGYTHLAPTSATMYTLSTSMEVIDADAKVTFVAPPSGNVEIGVNYFRDSVSSNKTIWAGLSDNATYNQATAELGDGSTTWDLIYTYGGDVADETDDRYNTIKFVAGGLTAGTEYTYWLGLQCNSATVRVRYGGTTATSPDRFYPPIIMKATALPASIHTDS